MKEKEKSIEEKETALKEKEKIIEEKETALKEKEKSIEEKETVLKEKEIVLKEKEKSIEEKEITTVERKQPEEKKVTPDTTVDDDEVSIISNNNSVYDIDDEYREIKNEYDGLNSKLCNRDDKCINWKCEYTHKNRKICQCQTLVCNCNGIRKPCWDGINCKFKNISCYKYHKGHRVSDCKLSNCMMYHCNFRHINDEDRCCKIAYWNCNISCNKLHVPCPCKDNCNDKGCKLKHPSD